MIGTKYVKAFRKKLVARKFIQIERHKDHYKLKLYLLRLRVSRDEMRRLADWILSHE